MHDAGLAARVAAAEKLLREHGFDGARLRPAGHESEIAAVTAPPSEIARLAQLAPEIKALGFRYVTVDVTPEPAE